MHYKDNVKSLDDVIFKWIYFLLEIRFFHHCPKYRIFLVLYVQEVVTLQKKNIYLHQKMRFTPFINYYHTFG